ncbi:MAG: hypothetical protein GDA56_27380 [Hormoscilla sp. GM7CHS1pb]|nr:hypothetical protein [Hormoscilla sp. GM7CHS1pb]
MIKIKVNKKDELWEHVQWHLECQNPEIAPKSPFGGVPASGQEVCLQTRSNAASPGAGVKGKTATQLKIDRGIFDISAPCSCPRGHTAHRRHRRQLRRPNRV